MPDPSRFRFGLQTPPTQPWPELVATWQRAEALGFDSLWLPDHLVRPYNRSEWMHEGWSTLAGLAAVTTRARIGILVSCNTFRHPGVLAKQAITVDHISGGRLEFGLGAGWFAPEHQMFGIPFPEPPELVGRFREAVELIDAFLREDTSSYAGHYYTLHDAIRQPGPLQRPRPPLTLGANGPAMLRVAARHADRWNSSGSPATLRGRIDRLDAACAAIGRDPAAIIRSVLYVPIQMPEERPWDSPDAFADYVGRYAEAGLTEFLFQPPKTAAWDVVERIATDLLPRLRAATTG